MTSQSKKEWENTTLARARERFPERPGLYATNDDIAIDPAYTPEDASGVYLEKSGFPGQFPFTRGVQPTMYRGKLWTMRQYAGFGDAEESNGRYKYLLSHGQTGLSVAFDLPTQIGYDSDDPMAEGEVGKVGVAISSLKDMEILFADIPLEEVTTSMTINTPASILLALYVATSKKQGADLKKLGGTVQNDILKEYIARGTYSFPPEPSMRLITDVIAYCKDELPSWNPISISGYHMREAGCTAGQEVAFTLSDAFEYIDATLSRGLGIDEFSPRLAYFFACHSNFLEEIAKFRAARHLYATETKERYDPQDPRSMQMRFHTQTGGATLTAQQPDNNIVRSAFQALAAVLGGTQSLHVNAKDEALALPTKETAQLALRTQQLIAYETGVADSIDPVAGSYTIERLTAEIEKEAKRYIDRIDAMGGAIAAIRQGFQQREIQEAAWRYQRQIEDGKRVIVGVNEYIMEEEPSYQLMRIDPAVVQRQIARVRQVRVERDNNEVQSYLNKIENAAKGRDNLMPIFIGAVEHDVTLGEICKVLRDVWGEYTPSTYV